jgi:hypothetical protein
VKLGTVISRMLLVVGMAAPLGVFALSSDNWKANQEPTGEVEGNMTNAASEQAEPSPPATDTASPKQQKIKCEGFPGCRIKTEDAVKRAPLIIVATFVDFGIRSLGSSKVYHDRAKVEVLQVLKGYISKELSLSFYVYDASPIVVEKTPEVGQRYIIFIKDEDGINAIKFLPDTDEQRWQIMELISSAAREHP